jgi:hypothetical protein
MYKEGGSYSLGFAGRGEESQWIRIIVGKLACCGLYCAASGQKRDTLSCGFISPT